MSYDLGFINLEQKTLQPLDNPVRPEVVTHVLGTFRYLCVRVGQTGKLERVEGNRSGFRKVTEIMMFFVSITADYNQNYNQFSNHASMRGARACRSSLSLRRLRFALGGSEGFGEGGVE
jgi:hypothetical protein